MGKMRKSTGRGSVMDGEGGKGEMGQTDIHSSHVSTDCSVFVRIGGCMKDI